MVRLFLFEFCDQKWIPSGARECLFEAMEACNSGVRSFNSRVAEAVLQLAEEEGIKRIVELGAGRAPITTHLAIDDRTAGMSLVPCDLVPDKEVYTILKQQYPDVVQPIYEPVDITKEHDFADALLVMCGMMHHVPFALRPTVLRSLSETNAHIAVFEPLKRTTLSILMTLLAFVPAILLPITFFHRRGRWRRILWCWLLPIVAPMFVWDGVVSCLRQWTADEWRQNLDDLGDLVATSDIEDGWNSTTVMWSGRRAASVQTKPADI